MTNIPAKVADRLAAGIKRFQPIIASAKDRDIGESDTVTIVVEMLAEIFGYDKFAEITSEFAIRGTYCDLATKFSDNKIQMLFEVKAINHDLKEHYVKQAVDYAANKGVDWVVLTTAAKWRVYKITFAKPIDNELVIEIDFMKLNPKNAKDIEALYLFAKEGWLKSVLGEYHGKKNATSRFLFGAVLLSDAVVDVVRRELRRITPDVKIAPEEIRAILTAEVIKRDVIEGEMADGARKTMAKAANKALKVKLPKADNPSNGDGAGPLAEPVLEKCPP